MEELNQDIAAVGDEPISNFPGPWIGIDLGTTYSTCAVWDTSLSRAKVIRLDIASTPKNKATTKHGKLVPSAILFIERILVTEQYQHAVVELHNILSDQTKHEIVAIVGDPAMELIEHALQSEEASSSIKETMSEMEDSKTNTKSNYFWYIFGRSDSNSPSETFKSSTIKQELKVDSIEISKAIVTSFKRMMGKNSKDECGEDFLKHLPYEVVQKPSSGTGLSIRIHPFISDKQTDSSLTIDILPEQLAAILLQALRESAERSLSSFRNKIKPPSSAPSGSSNPSNLSSKINNVVIGVPASYSRQQRQLIEKSARLAGFDGFVRTLSESTAAIMAYGLFTSSKAHFESTIDGSYTPTKVLTVLVFDMGGGTTDVTIAKMTKTMADVPADESIQYSVVATEGDPDLGGDDVDYLLYQWFISKHSAMPDLNVRELQRVCCHAKELLCGDGKDEGPKDYVEIEYQNHTERLTMEEFEIIIRPFLIRSERVLEDALIAYQRKQIHSPDLAIDEVVLIGGIYKCDLRLF